MMCILVSKEGENLNNINYINFVKYGLTKKLNQIKNVKNQKYRNFFISEYFMKRQRGSLDTIIFIKFGHG